VVTPTKYRRGEVLTADLSVTNVAGPLEVPITVLLVEA
jgi:hypothetical protein